MNDPHLNEPPSGSSPGGQFRKGLDYVRGFENWNTCLRLRHAVGHPNGRTRTVLLRNGLRMKVRVGTPDISILWEVLLGGAYQSAESLIKSVGAPCDVLDLGANIGAFTLRCAHSCRDVRVFSYEPGPQNAAMLRANLQLNPRAASRVAFHEEAVGAEDGTAFWNFDAANPGGSSIAQGQQGIEVKTVSLRTALQRCDRPIALLKIDIEGSEYELLEGTQQGDWQNIPAVLTELHPDPAGRSTPQEWLARMADYGFKQQTSEFSSILLRR